MGQEGFADSRPLGRGIFWLGGKKQRCRQSARATQGSCETSPAAATIIPRFDAAGSRCAAEPMADAAFVRRLSACLSFWSEQHATGFDIAVHYCSKSWTTMLSFHQTATLHPVAAPHANASPPGDTDTSQIPSSHFLKPRNRKPGTTKNNAAVQLYETKSMPLQRIKLALPHTAALRANYCLVQPLDSSGTETEDLLISDVNGLDAVNAVSVSVKEHCKLFVSC